MTFSFKHDLHPTSIEKPRTTRRYPFFFFSKQQETLHASLFSRKNLFPGFIDFAKSNPFGKGTTFSSFSFLHYLSSSTPTFPTSPLGPPFGRPITTIVVVVVAASRFDTNAAATGEGIFATTIGDSWKIGADAALKLVSPAVGSKSDAADWRIDILIARLLTLIVSPLLLFGLPSI